MMLILKLLASNKVDVLVLFHDIHVYIDER